MKKTKFLNRIILIAFISSVFVACKSDDDAADVSRTQFGVFKVLNDNKTVDMNGDIDSNTLSDFNDMVAQFPNIDKINMISVPGSLDDDTNLQVSLLVHQQGIATHLANNGLIASGGVDFFLAGVTRTKGTNTMIGVHSWSDGVNDANDFPEGHPNHLPYINYYTSVGFSQVDAEAFYYFTINAAPASDIHYMTEEEISQYNILTP